MSLITPIPHPVFHPVIQLPNEIELYDFSQGYDENRVLSSAYGVGKYNKHRPNMYTGELFEQDNRTLHMGIDIGCPVGTPVYAFDDGKILHQGLNAAPFDYGHVLITEHNWHNGDTYWVLWGHLSKESIQERCTGQLFSRGELLGWVGPKSENGGWNPHLHIQLSRSKPETHDLPGVIHVRDRTQGLIEYPDPRRILGQIYP